MQTTHIIYKGKAPKETEINEIKELIPSLEIKDIVPLVSSIVSENDDYYKVKRLSWNWFAGLFPNTDIQCLILQPGDLKGIGVIQHWGWYFLDDDKDHQFYMTNLGSKLEPRAKTNGFKSNFAWMFVHEYLHGCRWAETRDREKAAKDVHDWEAAGKLKERLAFYNNDYNNKAVSVSLWQKMIDLVKKKNSLTPTDVLPLVARKAELVLKEMKALGYEMRITQGFRSIAEQDALYAQGRPKGVIVTNAKGGQSFHNYGVALDFVFKKEGYKVPKTVWNKFGAIGKKHGFEWGGDWTSFVDEPHLQMPLGYLLKDFQQGKVDYTKFN